MPVLRNKNPRHGQENPTVNTACEFAQYALNLVEINVVFPIKIYFSIKQKQVEYILIF